VKSAYVGVLSITKFALCLYLVAFSAGPMQSTTT